MCMEGFSQIRTCFCFLSAIALKWAMLLGGVLDLNHGELTRLFKMDSGRQTACGKVLHSSFKCEASEARRAVASVRLVKQWTRPVVSVQVPSLSINCGCLIPTIFRTISRPTAGQREGCYPRENSNPGGNLFPVTLDYCLGDDSRKGVT